MLYQAIKERRAREPATPKQRNFLRWQDHERADDPNLTVREAITIIGNVKNGIAA